MDVVARIEIKFAKIAIYFRGDVAILEMGDTFSLLIQSVKNRNPEDSAVVEPSKLKMTARRYEDENTKFRTFLKNHADPDILDKQFAALHNELFSGYDCCRYHNCCAQYSVSLSDEDIEKIAAFINLSKEDFISQYACEGDDGYVIKPPCPFLENDGSCRVQPCKPDECRGYPYTDQPDRISSLYGVIGFTEVCPVVFEIVQRLKQIYGFKSRV